MFQKEFHEWFEINKKWLYSGDYIQNAYTAWCAGVKQQEAVEHSVYLTALGRGRREGFLAGLIVAFFVVVLAFGGR